MTLLAMEVLMERNYLWLRLIHDRMTPMVKTYEESSGRSGCQT